ncbi:MAG: hypothetical protein PHW59_08060 [Desulfobacterales bacterium]|jgi:small-conductance mechanosensitive channel|nr:hypothetical protein [Desulfobacterales bacterium]MDD4462616.1 hypothetical protein [Desulfobacterales bacterium]
MEQINELIKSPVFWFASVFIAFLMSLFSGFAKDWIQKLWATRSDKKKQELEKKSEAINKKIESLKNDHQLLVVYQSNIVYQKMRQVLYLIVQYVAFLFSMSNFINESQISALAFMVFFFFMHVVLTLPISRTLREMRVVLNGALENEEAFFSG